MTDDVLNIWINRDDSEVRGAAGFRPVLVRLDESFLPKPSTVEESGGDADPISGYLDDAVLAALERGGMSVVLEGAGLWADFLQLGVRTTISLRFDPDAPADEVRSLFVDLVEQLAPTYARAHLEGAGQRLHEQHYAGHERSFYADGLYWLNYFGPDELARQGGDRLADNPFARATRTGSGLLLEVGDGPSDSLTPEGERRLVEATNAMPPVGGDDDAIPATLVTVEGVTGFLDPVDQGFWVTKHVDGRLDPSTIRRLESLPGRGEPPIRKVHVLFSTGEAAVMNHDPLAGVGAETWYVDPETGQPRPVG